MRRRAVAVVALAAMLATVSAVSAVGSASPAEQRARSVTVRMGGAPPDFTFRGVPKTLNSGSVRFTFRNTSTQPQGVRHNFTVVDTFGSARPFRSRTLASGQSQTLTVNLRPGVYVALCTIGDGFHAANRMLTSFTVQQ